MKYKIFVFSVGILFSTITSVALANSISLEAYLDLVEKHDAQLKKHILEQTKTKFQMDLNLPDHSWELAVSSEYGLETRGGEDTKENSASITKNILTTGSELELSYEKNELDARDETIQSVELRQNIFKNAFGSQSRKLEKILGNENKVLKMQVIEGYEEYLSEKTQSYLQFKLDYENYLNAEAILKEMRVLQKEIRAKRRNGIANVADAARIETEVLDYERQLLNAKLKLDISRKQLTKNFDYEYKTMKLMPEEPIPFVDKTFNFDLEEKSFWSSSRSYKILQSQKEVAVNKVSYTRHELFPETELILGYNKEEAERFSTATNREEVVAGIQLTYAFDNPTAKAEFDQAKYNQKIQEIDYLTDKKSLERELFEIKEGIQVSRLAISLLEKQAASGGQLVSEVRRRFRRGVVDLKTFVEAQQKYRQIKYDLIREKIELSKLKVQWLAKTDQLVTKNEL